MTLIEIAYMNDNMLFEKYKQLQGQVDWFKMAELSYRDPAEAKRRLQCESDLKMVGQALRERGLL